MKVFIENPQFYHYFFVQYYIWKKVEVHVFDFGYSARKIRWLRRLIDKRLVSLFCFYLDDREGDRRALDNIEGVYSHVAAKSILIKSMVRLYADENITLAFKKALVEELSVFYNIQAVLDETRKADPDEEIVLIPYKYFETLRILLKSGIAVSDLKNICVPFCSKIFNVVDRSTRRFINKLLFFLYAILSIGLVLFKRSMAAFWHDDKHNYQYAIPITHPRHQFKFEKNKTFDFLLDHTNLRKDNTVFLWLKSFDRAKAGELESKSYHVIDLSKKNVFLSPKFGYGKNAGTILKDVFEYVASNILTVFGEKDFVVRCGYSLLATYLFWSAVLNKITFHHYITFNDEAYNHVGRNILLQRFNSKSWYYVHSNSFEFLWSENATDVAEMRYWVWSFLYYDCYVAWNRKIIDFQLAHRQKVGCYYNVGCLWSAFQSDGVSSQEFRRQIIDRTGAASTAKIVTFFDTAFFVGSRSQFPHSDGIRFYTDILAILKDVPNISVIIKPKKPIAAYTDKTSVLYSNGDFVDVLNQLANTPNCFLADVALDPFTVAGISDLVVSYAFSSSTIEALGTRKRAIYYDPTGKFRKNCYNDIPDFIAYGYEELKALVNKMLFQMTPEEYDEYLNKRMLNRVDDYLDGKGLARFRELLAKN